MADWRRLLSVLIAAAVPMAVHAQVLGFPFVSFDDPVYVAESPFYGPGVSLTELLLTPQLGYPIPVTVAAYRLVEAVFGVETWAFHGLNWLLHAGAGLLLFLFLERLLDRRRALLGSLLWSLHPLAVEPV
ncbi:MAG: hypothetical protein FJ098_09640, partial [Deltaproteobacteria bacterium]|nr:hypothetical protein [Deltaproteobacteria bacterium]